MRKAFTLPATGSFLRWAGLLFIVLAIIGGILGMHGLNGVPVATMGSGSSGSVAHTVEGMTVEPAPTSAHTPLEPCHPTEAAMLGDDGFPGFDCSPVECNHVMTMHGDCMPILSYPGINVPLPGILATHAPGAAFIIVPDHKSADRILDPPSLSQLSISRT